MELPFNIKFSSKLALLVFFIPIFGFSQQNFFNVPSVEITPIKKLFFQQQINFASQLTPFGYSTLSWGIGKNTEMGINLFNFSTQPNSENFHSAQWMVNGLKKIAFSPKIGCGIGGQLGMTFSKNLMTYSYQNLVFSPNRGIKKLVVGLYQGNSNFLGRETKKCFAASSKVKWGIQAGIEKVLIPNFLSFQSDFQWGTTQNQQLITGLVLQTGHQIFWSLGRSITGIHANSPNYWVFEFTFSPTEQKHPD